jgi:protein-tyrosine phosphatase
MIDLHTHILWGLDDGARTIRDSLEMCRIAYRDGIRTVVATPHTLNGVYQNDRPSILAKVRELNEVISHQLLVNSSEVSNQLLVNSPNVSDQLSVTSNQSSVSTLSTNNGSRITDNELRILPGADVNLCEGTLSQLDGGKLTTLGDGGKCLLLEFPFHGIPYGAEEVLFQLVTRGIIPIISHPERNLEVAQNPRRYHEMIRMGCLGQVTAMSLTGGFGPEVMRAAEKLLTNGFVHLIASDAHCSDGRPPILSDGVCAAEKLVGREEALRMVTEYPQALLEGRRPNVGPISN